MRIVIEELPAEGLEVEFGSEEDWARRAAAAALDGEVAEVRGRLAVRRVGPGVLVDGTARAAADRSCDRCLAPVRVAVEGRVDLYFEAPGAADEDEVALTADELDVGFLDEGVLDLGQVLTEFLVLEAPGRVRCEDPGVTRLVEGECRLEAGGGSDDDVDPRFSVLRNLKLEE